MCQNNEIPVKRRKRQVGEEELTEEERLLRSYGTKLGYSCGLARMFQTEEGDLYDEMWLTCNWNKTWTPVTELDQCMYTMYQSSRGEIVSTFSVSNKLLFSASRWK